jgi:hypothetical protein
MEFTVKFCTKYKRRAPIYRLKETSKTAEILTLVVEPPNRFLRYPSETAQFYPYQIHVRTA